MFASALWAVDQLYHAVEANVTRWNFQGGATSLYGTISVQNNIAVANPIFYGLWLFTDATAGDAQVVPCSVSGSDGKNLVAWCTQTNAWQGQSTYQQGRSCNTRIVVVFLNKEVASTIEAVGVSIDLGGLSENHSPEAYLRVLAPKSNGAYAKNGIVFAGQTFDGSTTGLPLGVPSVQTINISPSSPSVSILFSAGESTISVVEVFDGCSA